MAAFLGIDIGTSGTKTLAIDHRAKILAEATSEYPCYHPRPLWSEHAVEKIGTCSTPDFPGSHCLQSVLPKPAHAVRKNFERQSFVTRSHSCPSGAGLAHIRTSLREVS